jgi:Fe-S oxidoreductase
MLFAIHVLAFAVVTCCAVYMTAKVLLARAAYVRLGRPFRSGPPPRQRLRTTLADVFGQGKLLKDARSGVMHVVMFYGFIVLQFGAVELIVKGLVYGWELPFGSAHRYFSLVQEITVFLVLLAVYYAFHRRYVEKLKRLKRGFKAGIVLIFISALMVTVVLSLAFEAISLGKEPTVYAPLSSLIAMAFGQMGEQAAKAMFYVFWWLHLIALLAFAVYVPQSKHAHLVFAPLNIFWKRTEPPGKLSHIDLEDETAEEFGVGRTEQFRGDQLLDLYACVECGRCTSMCPAAISGKTLSPMHLIMNIRDHHTAKAAAVTSRSPWMPASLFGPEEKDLADRRLVGEVITEEELWACTTCRNCEDQCPVGNEHVDMIVDMRRYLVLTEGSMPGELSRTFQNIERQSNPWGLNRNDRIRWREGLEDIAPTVDETEEFEYLFFVGSMGSYDNRSIKVARAVATLLHLAGVKLAILGNREKNSGDVARRAGNELLFQQLAAENIETFETYNVRKIVTICPHTYNTFRNEYPEYGLKAEVIHHTELLHRLVREGRLKPERILKERIVYHDSCYLGRYNGIYEQPREILASIPGVELAEMERNRENGMCCGAGGGMMWIEERQGSRVNVLRTRQALEVSPTLIASGCPYCLTMLGDGVKSEEAESRVRVMDIAEILLTAVQPDPGPEPDSAR